MSRGTKNTLSRNSSSISAPSCRASLVLPVPPGPVSVRSRVPASSRRAVSISVRPTKVVGSTGRLFGRASSMRRAGKELGRPGITAWKRRSGWVAKPVLAEIPQLDTGWEVCACQGPRRVREQDLAAVARGRDPRDPVEGETYIVAADEGHLACVNAHPDPDRVALRPGVIREGPLSVDRGHDRRRGIRKCREDRVALRPDDAAAVAGDGLVEQGTVLVQQLAIGVTQLLDESGGARDVGEQEGDGPGGQRPCSRRVDPRLGRRRGWA